MNAARRKRLLAIVTVLDENLGVAGIIQDEEQAAFDAMPESIQSGTAGEKSTAWLSAIEDMIGGLEQARDAILEMGE